MKESDRNGGRNAAIAWDVYLRGKLIDTVWFTGYTAEEARKSLVEHDGYDSRIEVRRERQAASR